MRINTPHSSNALEVIPMMFDLHLESFRAFSNSGLIHLAPITVITGGNSSGKSSILAALHYLCSSPLGASSASFNREPFLLGSFEHIVHNRSRQSHQRDRFTLTVHLPLKRSGKSKISNRALIDARAIRLSFEFRNRHGQAGLNSFEAEVNNTILHIDTTTQEGEANLAISGAGVSRGSSKVMPSVLPPDILASSPYLLTLFLASAFSRQVGESTEETDLIRDFSQILQTAFAAIPRCAFAAAPLRSKPSRTYDPTEVAPQAEGAHVPTTMAQMSRAEPQNWKDIRAQLNAFGKSSQLYNAIDVQAFGKQEGDPFQIKVSMQGGKRNIIDVGYGVSQALPIIFETARRPKGSMVLLQQPEVHLHPEAQVALGDYFVDNVNRLSGNIVIETHSDFIVDRIRRRIREGQIKSEEVSVNFVTTDTSGSKVEQIHVDADGRISAPPEGYRDFFVREEIDNLGL
jgi:predicted ATPase